MTFHSFKQKQLVCLLTLFANPFTILISVHLVELVETTLKVFNEFNEVNYFRLLWYYFVDETRRLN